MRNKFLAKIVGAVTAFAMAIGVGAVIANNREVSQTRAEEQTVSWAATSGGLGSGVGSGTINTGSFSWSYTRTLVSGDSYTGWSSNCIQLGKNGGVENLTLTTSAITGTIKSVSVECASYQGKHKVSIVVGSTTYLASTATSSWTTVAEKSGTGTSEGTITVSFTDGTRALYIRSLTVVYESSGSGGGGPVSLTNPNPQYNDSTKIVSWTTDLNALKYQIKVDDAADYSDINTETYNASGLSAGEEHTVFIKAVGDETNYLSSEGSVTFTPFAGKNYVLCSSVDDLQAGTKYIVSSASTGTVQVMSTETSTNNRKQTEVTVNEVTHKILTTSSVLVLTLGGSSGEWTFLTTNYTGTDGYFESASTGTNNNLLVTPHANVEDIPDNGKFTISFSDSGVPTIQANSGNRTYMRYNSNNGLFSLYETSSSQNDLYLWKEYKAMTGLNVTGTPSKLSGYYDSEEFDPTGISAYEAVYEDDSTKALSASDIVWPELVANMGTIRGSYSENGDTVYTPTYNISVSADSLSSLTISGTMVASYYMDDDWDKGSLAVTANYASDKHFVVTGDSSFAYYSDSEMTNEVATPADLGAGADQIVYVKATYMGVSNTVGYSQTVTVSHEHGTINSDPLTAAEAIAIGNGLAIEAETTKIYYIQGVVSEIVSNELDTANNRATFWIQNGETVRGFEAYRIHPTDGCTNYGQLLVGAVVLIKCNILRFNASTIENGSTSSLESITYTPPTLTDINLDKTSLTLEVGNHASLSVSPVPLGADLGVAVWESSSEDVATVDQDGNVEAVGLGSTTITVTAGGFTKTCSVKVVKQPLASYSLIKVGSTSGYASSSDVTFVDGKIWNIPGNQTLNDGLKIGGNLKTGAERKLYSKSTYDSVKAISITHTSADSGVTVNSLTLYVYSSAADAAAGDTSKAVESVSEAYSPNSVAVFKPTVEGTNWGGKYFSIVYDMQSNTTSNKGIFLTRLAIDFTDLCSASLIKTIDGNETFVDETFDSVDTIKLRFGATISKDYWDSINSDWPITDYGVMLLQKTTLTSYGASSIEEAYNDGNPITIIRNGSGSVPNLSGNNYKFTVRISIADDVSYYDDVICAAPFIVAGGVYYFLGEMQESVNSLAEYSLTNGGSRLSDAALTYLTTAH